MNKLRIITIIIALSYLLSGCLQIETTISVKKDGSGIINEKVLMGRTFVNMIKEFAMAFQDSVSSEEFVFFKDEEIIADAKNYGEDVKYISHQFISNDHWEGFEAVYSFADVSQINVQPDPDSKVGLSSEEMEAPADKEYYFFRFNKGDIAELIIDRPDIKSDNDSKAETYIEDTTEQSDEELGEEALKMMEGMKIEISIQVGGKIASTNASYVDGSKITLFKMDFGEMMKDKGNFKEFKNKDPKSIEEMKEFLEKFPGMKIEIEKPISVKFK